MLSQKCAQIISYLCQRKNESGCVRIDELTKMYNVSDRTIRYYIDKIDYFLKKNSFSPLIREKGSGIRLNESEANIQKIQKALRESDMQNYVMSKQERIMFIILMLFETDVYIKYEEIAEEFFVSRKTAIEDVRTIKEEIGEDSIKSTKYGIMLHEDENRRRRILIDYLLHMFSPLELWEIAMDIFPNISIAIERKWRDLVGCTFIDACEKSLNTIEKKNKKYLSDDYYYLVIVLTAFSLTHRSRSITLEVTETEKSDAFLSDYFDEVGHALGGEIPPEERRFIQNEVVRLFHLTENEGLGMKADLIAEQFIILISETMGEKYYLDQLLRQSLREHFERILKPGIKTRPVSGIIDGYIEKARTLYDEVIRLLDTTVFISLEDKKNEAALITLHFLAADERKSGLGNNRYRVLVVCLNGIGTAKMLSAVVMKHFPEIEIIDTASLHMVNDLVEKVKPDFILTTVPVTSKNVTTVEVRPLLETDDIEKIRAFIKSHPKKYVREQQNVYEKLINVINETCDVKDLHSLEKKLKSVLNIAECTKKELKLKDLLTPHTIQTNISATDWEDAIEKSAQPLLESDCIEERYVEAMIKNIHEMGPYVVIAPGIAMPHAMPADGVRASCISMTVLKNEVEFGNAANDPVKLVFCLGSVDNEEHMNVLSGLIGLISDKNLIMAIKNAISNEQVLELLDTFWQT